MCWHKGLIEKKLFLQMKEVQCPFITDFSWSVDMEGQNGKEAFDLLRALINFVDIKRKPIVFESVCYLV